MIIATQVASSTAHAQLWDALDTKPTPNVVIGVDTSVTMRITPNCNDCHKRPYDPRQRMFFAVRDLQATLPLFSDLFAYGSFVYSGSRFAKIRTDRGRNGVSMRPIIPNPDDLPGTFAQVMQVLNNLDTEGRSERYLPGGQEVSCLTPTNNCSGDGAVVNNLLNQSVPGLTLPVISTTATTCSVGVPRTIVPSQELQRHLQSFEWPRYTTPVSPADIANQFCTPLRQAGTALRNELALCTNNPNALIDLTTFNCNPAQVSQSICTSSLLATTCVCQPTLQGCGGGNRLSQCGTPLDFKARQQVALCEAYNPDRDFGQFFATQPDNVVSANGCRENALLMFTDGYRGGHQGVVTEAPNILTTYRTRGGDPNAYVFRVATPFTGSADAMQRRISNDTINQAFLATDQLSMLNSFGAIANRILQGTYTSAALALDRFESRVAFYNFTVPSPPHEDYFGRPSRIAWHSIDENGAIDPNPIFETDWQTKAGVRQTILAPGASQAAEQNLGPNGTWLNNTNMIRNHAANSLDRNGDLTADQHPAVSWGYMLGGGSSRPVVVEAPREIPFGSDAAAFSLFQTSVRNRLRVIYAVSNGWLHAIHAGEPRTQNPAAPNFTLGRRNIAPTFYYDDSVPDAGTELFRFRPAFAENIPNLDRNRVVQQDIMNGEIVVKEVQMQSTANTCQGPGPCPQGDPSDYATVLIMTQGTAGPGFAAVNVTDPNAPAFLWERTLPGANDTASSEPAIYQFAQANAQAAPNPVVVLTGGLGGSRTLYAYSVNNAGNNNPVSQVNLPGGSDYPTSPVCLDATGRGVITHCYALGRDGTLARVEVITDGNGAGTFGTVTDITPNGVRGGGRSFYTRPVVFFGADNAVNISFGSGDIESLAAPSGVTNNIYKLVDRDLSATALSAGVCTPTVNGGSGIQQLTAGEMVVSPPIVSKGVVAFTTYTPGTSGCIAGTGRLRRFDFQTCVEPLDPNATPLPGGGTDIGAGIHASPVLLRNSEQVVTHSSANPIAAGAAGSATQTRGGRRQPIKRIYWRPVLTVP